MSNPLVKGFVAKADIPPYSAVQLADNGGAVELAAAAPGKSIGVCELGGKTGDVVDVVLSGIAEVRLGGNVAEVGSVVIATANGAAVLLTGSISPSIFTTIIGKALKPGVSGDVVPVLI